MYYIDSKINCMKRGLYLLIFVFLLSNFSFAQTSSTIRLKAGDQLSDAPVKSVIYRYPEFVFGKLYTINGDSSGGLMNYNYLAETMQFISPNGDTLAIADEASIRFIDIGGDRFIFSDGYLEVVGDYKFSKLAVKQRLKQGDRQKIGAFGIPTSSGKIESMEEYKGGYGVNKLQINEDLLLTKETQFYFSNKKGNFLPINKKNLAKAFSKERQLIETYFETYQIDLKKEEEVKQLFSFLQTKVSEK